MKKLLCITPHLSTGGLPQYLLKKIKSLSGEYEIFCVEYEDCTGGVFVVQREQIQSICKNRFFTLCGDKNKLIDIITDINPDIIHFEEMPEYFMDLKIAHKIYTSDRKYIIVETSHDSSFDCNKKRVFPDKFIFVSEYQKRNVESLNIKSDVIEYPVGIKLRTDRDVGLKRLGLDVDKKHVFHVGLFTPRKNQKEFIEYARMMEQENVQFHCIGNTADNFKFYWEPLLNDLPKNVKIWGERKDVHNFYSCMDLFLFTSRGHVTDKETAPIVIKEAISFNVPSLIYNLPVYLNRYDCYSNIEYLDEKNTQNNINLIRKKLGIDCIKNDVLIETDPNQNLKDNVIIISTHPNHKSIVDTTKSSILQAKKAGYKVILTSHYPVDLELQNLADYYIFDKNNPILKHNFYSVWRSTNNNFNAEINFKSCDSDDYHGLAVCLNYYNAITFAHHVGFKKAICYNYDLIVDDRDFQKLYDVFHILKRKNGFFFYDKALEGDTLKTVFHGVDIEFYLKIFKYYSSEEYSNLVNFDKTSNGLEQFYFQRFKPYIQDIHIDYNHNEETFFPNSSVNIFSMVEYLTVIPSLLKTEFVVFSYFNNKLDDRINKIIIKKDGVVVKKSKFEIKSNGWFYVPCSFEYGHVYEIENLVFDTNNNLMKSYKKTFKSLEEINNNGNIQFKT